MLFPRNDHQLGGQRLLGKCFLASSPALPGQLRDFVEPCPLPGCFTIALQNLPQGTASLIKTSYLGPGTSLTMRCSPHIPWPSHSHQGVPYTLGSGGRCLFFFFNKCLPDNGRLNSKHLSTFTKVCHQLEAGAAPSQAANQLVCRITLLLWAPSQSQAGPHCLCPLWPAAGIRAMILPAAVTVFPELCQDPSLSVAVTSRENV